MDNIDVILLEGICLEELRAGGKFVVLLEGGDIKKLYGPSIIISNGRRSGFDSIKCRVGSPLSMTLVNGKVRTGKTVQSIMRCV